jgi:hypothetical protein
MEKNEDEKIGSQRSECGNYKSRVPHTFAIFSNALRLSFTRSLQQVPTIGEGGFIHHPAG